MVDGFLRFAIQYPIYALEVGLLGVMMWRGQWKRHVGLFVYVALLVALDALARPLASHHYGWSSKQFFYIYWLSNILLQLAAFLLICLFFRTACAGRKSWWAVMRLALPSVFVLVVGVCLFVIWHNYKDLFTAFLFTFEQYLYFTCLVLNTLLFVMIQYAEVADDKLHLFVCGLGLQFAGPAAGMALVVVAGTSFQYLAFLTDQICTFGMLLTWLHALRRVPRERTVLEGQVAVQRAAA